MSFITSRRWALEETFRGLRRDGPRSILALFLAALALSIPLFIAVVFYGLSEPLRSLPTSVELTVFTKEKADVQALADEVGRMPWVSGTEIIGRDAALRDLNAKLGLPASTAAGNPLPDILVVTLAPEASAEDIAAAAKRIEALPQVDFVPYEASWHEKLRAVSRAVWTGLALLGAVTALLVVLVLDTAIRMTTLAARSEMSTLYILGAAPVFAVRPYAWRGFILMACAAALSLALVRGGILMLQPALTAAAALYEGTLVLALPPALWCAGFVAAAAFCGSLVAAFAALSAWRSIRRGRDR